LPGGESMETLVDELQRIIENIIEERWKEVDQKVAVLDAWKTKLEDKVGSLSLKVSELTARIDGFSKMLVSKNEEYKKTIGDVNTEMEAIEKIMGKLVPSLAEEIKELRNVVEKMKKH
jgi:phage-related minor tail protein